MPLMPAPPMPTKWMCLTACFMRASRRRASCGHHRFDLVGDPRRRMRPRERARLRRHRQQRLARQAAQQVGEPAAARARPAAGGSPRSRAAIQAALSRWCEVVLATNGTSTAATPAAHSSLTVIAPARQTITSQSARRVAMSSMKGSTSASAPRGGVGGAARRRGRASPVWCVTRGRCAAVEQGDRLRHALVEHARAEAAADDEQAQRAGAAGEALAPARAAPRSRARTGLPVTTAFLPSVSRRFAGEAEGDAPRRPAQRLVAEQQRRVGVDEQQRLARAATPSSRRGSRRSRPCRAPRRRGARAAAARQLQKAPSSRSAPRSVAEQALAAQAGERDPVERDAGRRHEPVLHARSACRASSRSSRAAASRVATARPGITCPPVPAAMTSEVLHARPPRISCRFSMSTRSTIASATMFITIAEPP